MWRNKDGFAGEGYQNRVAGAEVSAANARDITASPFELWDGGSIQHQEHNSGLPLDAVFNEVERTSVPSGFEELMYVKLLSHQLQRPRVHVKDPLLKLHHFVGPLRSCKTGPSIKLPPKTILRVPANGRTMLAMVSRSKLPLEKMPCAAEAPHPIPLKNLGSYKMA